MKRPLDDARQIGDIVDAVDALAERPEDLELIGVLVQVDFLVRMAPVVVRRHVARDYDHRDGIESGVGDPGRGVGQARTEMGQEHTDFARRPRVAVGGVRGHLLVAGRNVANAALPERVEKPDDRVATQPKDHLDAEPFEIIGQQVGGNPCFRSGRDALDGRLNSYIHSVSFGSGRGHGLVELAEQLGLGRLVLGDRPTHPGHVHVVLERDVFVGDVAAPDAAAHA